MATIDNALFDGSERWSELENILTNGWVLLAEDLNDDSPSVTGYVAVAPHHFFGRDFIALLVVAEASRRRGVGRQLLRAATLRATSQTVFTSTNESNRSMLKLLTSEGWSMSGRLQGLDDGDPEIVFYRGAKSGA